MRWAGRPARGRGARAGRGGFAAWFPELAVLAVLAIATGCGGSAARNAAGPPPVADPLPEHVRAVTEFLDAVGRRDHVAMADRFGTAGGPIGDTGGPIGCALRKVGSWIGLGERCLDRAEVELRVDVIARILAHESYRVRAEEGVVGRGRAAVRVDVDVVRGGRGVVVPFVVIRADDGRWLVEQVELGAMAAGKM